MPSWIHNLGSIASLISLGVSLYVAGKVRSISGHYKQLARLPQFSRLLNSHQKNLERLQEEKNWKAAKKEAAEISVTSDQVKQLTTGKAKVLAVECMSASNEIEISKGRAFATRQVEDLYLKVVKLRTHLTHMLEDNKWR